MPIDVDEFLESKKPHELNSSTQSFENIPFMQIYLKKIENKVPVQIGRWNTVLTNNRLFLRSLPIRALNKN